MALKVLGKKGKYLVDIMIALTQLSFSLSLITYIITSAQSMIHTYTGYQVWIWHVAMGMWCVLVPIAWVRNIAKFSFTFLIGNLCIMSTVVIVSVYMTKDVYETGFGPGLVAMNHDSYWSMVGFSIYAYEGIGVVMPIMNNCACPEKFDKILLYAIMTLTVVYIFFGELNHTLFE